MSTSPFDPLNIDVFVDSGNVHDIERYLAKGWVRGVTTNPDLMARYGHTDALGFARRIAPGLANRPLAIAPVTNDRAEFVTQAKALASIEKNVFVKVPIIDPTGGSNHEFVRLLVDSGVAVNVTCVHTISQVEMAVAALSGCASGLVSVFAGRLADTGVDPMVLAHEASHITNGIESLALIWAGSRELLNVRHAAAAGTDVITVKAELLEQVALWGTDMETLTRRAAAQFERGPDSAWQALTPVQSDLLVPAAGG